MNSKERINNNFDIDVDDELFELEQELGSMLEEFDVEYHSEAEMMMTIEAIRPYVPVKENKWKTLYDSLSSVLRHSVQEVFYFSSLFWISNLFLVVIAVSAVLVSEVNPYAVILVLAPLPTLIGLLEVIKSRNTGMVELEMSLRYSLKELILSRMVVVGGFNLLLNIVLTLSMSVLFPEIMITKLLLYWITPFTIISALSLVVVSKFRQLYTLTAGLVLWIVIGSIISQSQVIERFESVSATFYIFLTGIAAIYIIVKIINIYRRGISYEFNH